jgi:hypothetical protein
MGHCNVGVNRDREQAKAQTGAESSERPGDGGSVMLYTEMFGYADPRRGRPLARCGQCELTWCAALRERRGASASGVDLVQLERAMDGWDVGREYTATERELGNVLCDAS